MAGRALKPATLCLPTAGWGRLQDEEGCLAVPLNPVPFPEASQAGAVPAERDVGHGLLFGAAHGVLGKLSGHLQTLPSTRSDADRGASPFSVVPCRTGGERAPVRSLPCGGGWAPAPHSPLLPLWQARPGRTLSPWQPKAPQCLMAASREGSGFKTILRDCFCLYYPNCAPQPPPHTHSCCSPNGPPFP